MSSSGPTTLVTGDWLVLGLAVVALLGSVHVALSVSGCRGLRELWRGSDGRASTSKFQAAIWTLAVAWALLSLLLAEAIIGSDSALSGGWDAFVGEDGADGAASFQPDYLALLGIPIGTAVAAKAITSSKVEHGTVVKPSAEQGLSRRRQAMHLVGDDRGRPALLDFQLVVFNLLLLSYFVATFLTEPTRGLPDLPETLLLLAGVSSGSYTLNKALERTTTPAIGSVRPSRILLGAGPVELEVHGGPFGSPGEDEDDAEPDGAAPRAGGVMLAGVSLEVAEWGNDRVRAIVPIGDVPEPTVPAGLGELVVFDTSGVPSPPAKVEVVHAPPAAAAASDERLPQDVLVQLEQELALVGAREREEEEMVAMAAPVAAEPGTSHLNGGEPVRLEPEDEV